MNGQLDLERLLRAHLAERADSRPSEGALDAILAVTGGIRPRRSWLGRLRVPPDAIADRVGLTSRVIWAIVVLALLLAAAIAVALVGGQGPHVVVPQPSLGTPSPSPSPPPSPAVATFAVGPCTIPEALTAGADAASPLGSGMSVSVNGRVAFVPGAAGQGQPIGQILVAGGAGRSAGVVATFQGQQPVQVVGASADGSTLLVTTFHFAGGGPAADHCGDLFLVRADGSAVTKLTANGPGTAAEGGLLGPDGREVAYVESTVGSTAALDLRLIDAAGNTRVLDPSPCPGGSLAAMPSQSGLPGWSPDGTRLAFVCDPGGVTVYPIAGGASQVLQLPAGAVVCAIAWTGDSTRLLVATAKAGPSQLGPLTVLSVDLRTNVATVVSRSSLSVEWVLWTAQFSPDRKWLLTAGGTPGSVPGGAFQQALYLINVASGASRQVLGEPDSLGTVQWLSDSSGFVFQGSSGQLEEIGVRGGAARTIGSFPDNGSFYWIGP
jgi:Tol biopolymer transport system component